MATTMASPGSLRTLLNIEEELKRLNATMERFEPFLTANKPTTERAYCCLRSTVPNASYHSEVARASCICDCHFTENAPTTSQEAQQPREDLKPVVREGDEEFSALAASLYEALEGTHNLSVMAHTSCPCFDEPGKCKAFDAIRVSRQLIEDMRPLYEDYKAQQRDHNNADREDAER